MTVVTTTPAPEPEPEPAAVEAVADAAESAADAATEIAATDAAARVEVAQIEADRDIAVAETNAAAAVAIATDQERIAWLEGRVNELTTLTSDLSNRLPLREPEAETVTLEQVTPEGTISTLTSTSPETNETLTEAIAESADENPAPEIRRGKRRAFI